MTREKLLSCPFCGGDAKYEKDEYKNDEGQIASPVESYEYVRCTECGAEIFEDNQDVLLDYPGESVVIDKWNSRTNPAVKPNGS